MRVLILGAAGFVGRHLVDALAASTWATPIAAVRQPTTFPAGVDVLLANATTEKVILDAIESSRADIIVDCVVSSEDGIIRNGEALFGAIAKRPTPAVYFSSMAVYGNVTGNIAEDAPLHANLGWYSSAKARAEALALQASVPVAVFRPGCIYGGNSPQWTLRMLHLLRAKRIGDLGDAGSGRANLVHIRDAVNAVLAVLQTMPQTTRAYNLVMPNPPTWNEYFVSLADSIGASPVRRIPSWQLRAETTVLALPLRVGSKLVKSLPPAIPPSLAALWRQDITLDPARITAELSMQWTSLANGLAERV